MKKKLTIEDIGNVIINDEYVVNGTLTICILTLKNGFKVTGESACIEPEEFDAEIGKEIAYQAALIKVWMLEGYLLKQKNYEANNEG